MGRESHRSTNTERETELEKHGFFRRTPWRFPSVKFIRLNLFQPIPSFVIGKYRTKRRD